MSRLTTPTWQIVAEMSIEGLPFFVVDDPDAVAKRALAAGATEVFAIADQPYGRRQGRVEDPYGHHWLIGKPLTPA